MNDPRAVYDLLLDKVAATPGIVEELTIGLTWTLCQSNGVGLAMSPGMATRTLPWSGRMRGRGALEVAQWIRSWDPFQATVAMAAINATINTDTGLMADARLLRVAEPSIPANLVVFEHFLPKLRGKRVAVVGRYPGLDRYRDAFDLTVLERRPTESDLPDTAAEFVLAEAEWVFLTGTSLINKTFPRLAELAHDAKLVLMGPTVPWLAEFAEFGIDYLAGVTVVDDQQLKKTVAEGGGVRIFDGGVSYALVDLRPQAIEQVDKQISALVARSERLQQEMDSWHAAPWSMLAPQLKELADIYRRLVNLDSRYRELWEQRQTTMNPGKEWWWQSPENGAEGDTG